MIVTTPVKIHEGRTRLVSLRRGHRSYDKLNHDIPLYRIYSVGKHTCLRLPQENCPSVHQSLYIGRGGVLRSI